MCSTTAQSPSEPYSHVLTKRERERSLPSDGWQMLPSEVNINKWHPPHVLDVRKSHSIASHLQNWQDRARTSGGLKDKYQTQAIQSTNLGNIKKRPSKKSLTNAASIAIASRKWTLPPGGEYQICISIDLGISRTSIGSHQQRERDRCPHRSLARERLGIAAYATNRGEYQICISYILPPIGSWLHRFYNNIKKDLRIRLGLCQIDWLKANKGQNKCM